MQSDTSLPSPSGSNDGMCHSTVITSLVENELSPLKKNVPLCLACYLNYVLLYKSEKFGKLYSEK